MKKKIVFVIPKPLSYRFREYQKISKEMEVEVVMGEDHSTEFGALGDSYKKAFIVQTSRVVSLFRGSLFYQTGTLRRFLSYRYDYFFIQANIRYVDFWLILLVGLLLNRPLLVHGQGIYKKGASPTKFSRIIYWLVATMPMKYVAYCDFSRASLIKIGVNPTQIIVFKNTMQIPSARTQVQAVTSNTGDDFGILFLGRARHGTGLEWLLKRLSDTPSTNGLVFHIIGGGPQYNDLVRHFACENIRFYGPVFDEAEIAKIALKCKIGIYPGNAGLSLLHYAALGLPPVFHNRFELHEGPEFSFFKPEFDSFTFEQGNIDSLLSIIRKLKRSPRLLINTSQNTLNTYHKLKNNSFADDLLHELQ